MHKKGDMTMKKIFALVVLSLFVMSGIALAEQGATSFSGKNYIEQGVYVDAYNGTNGTLTANAVVVFDAAFGNAGTTFALAGGTISPGSIIIVSGAAVAECSTATTPQVFGVVDSVQPNGLTYIASSTSGRICIRGPHLVMVGTAPTYGALYFQGPVTGKADQSPVANNGQTLVGSIGICINATTTAALAGVGNGACLIWVQPTRSY
jgi:hypothetical protein